MYKCLPLNKNTVKREDRIEQCLSSIEYDIKNEFQNQINRRSSIQGYPSWSDMKVSFDRSTMKVEVDKVDNTILVAVNVSLSWLNDNKGA